MRFAAAALLLVTSVLLGGGNCVSAGPCTDDAQCDATGEGYTGCNLETGFCVCKDDRGCGENEVCNALGRCQTVAGCQSNDDCGDGGGQDLFCDVVSAQCLSVQECNPAEGQRCCTLDDQCPYRQICDGLTLTCVEGCRDNADCLVLQGEGCVGASLGRLGICADQCTDDSLCPLGSICNLGEGVCEIDTRGPYCQGCSGGVASDDCGGYGNYCLVDSVNGGEFCGVDCSRQQACPNGYSCTDVVIIPSTYICLFPEICDIPEGQGTGNCTRTGGPCAVDEDCPQGPPFGDCKERAGRAGSCELDPGVDCERDSDCAEGTCNLIACLGSEGDNTGFCSCTRDTDCPRDTCEGADNTATPPVAGHCELSGHECYLDFECDVIACVEGGCLIGQNCAPADGRNCNDFLPDPVPGP